MRDDYLMTCESLKEAKKYKHFVQNHYISSFVPFDNPREEVCMKFA